MFHTCRLAGSNFIGLAIGAVTWGWLAAGAIAQAPALPIADRSTDVRLNTVGYLPQAPKQATIGRAAESFAVIRADDGQRVLEGRLTGPVRNEDSGEDLYVADFSALAETGDYRLEVDGVGSSPDFRIAPDVYQSPFHTVTRAMYLMRCGTAVRDEFGGDVFEHEACHLDDGHLDLIVEDGAGESGGRIKVTGGWHDAGDYNKYVVNAGVTVGSMLRAWHDFQSKVETIDLGIPESGGALPDFLAEVKWELEWLLSMQADDGSIYHKVSTPDYTGFVPPDQEQERRFLGEWGTQATASFVAMMACAAREFEPYDQAFADRCLQAAKKSYAFLTAHPDYRRPGQRGFTTVGYDSSDWSARLWAAAEMWETTGNPAALADFESRAKSQQPSRSRWRRNRGEEGEPRQPRTQYEFDANWDWGNPHNLGLIVFLESEREGRDPELVGRIRESLMSTADEIVATRDAHGYARPLGTRYFWGCNGTVARQAIILEAARRVDARPEYRAVTLDALNHLFGRNVHGRSYVTGIGFRPPLFPHDRRSAADDVEAPWPGYVVGGPHPRPFDWQDDQNDYRTNEIAINWNGALIYALAVALDDPAKPSR